MSTSKPYYPSNVPGTNIRNAITGEVYKDCYVGTKSEKNFFRVIDSSGPNMGGLCHTRNSNKLFFESYSEFEKFYKIGEEMGAKFLNNDENYQENE